MRTETLADALPKEIERVRDMIPLYESCGPSSVFAVAMMKQSIKVAEQSILSGDTVGMIKALADLREYDV